MDCEALKDFLDMYKSDTTKKTYKSNVLFKNTYEYKLKNYFIFSRIKFPIA
jgi:hypothetical protein